ncbi:MAG: fimbrial adhesin EcpD [Serratia sp. (in: enterobacteria)]|uniref:fimbrial adhesin EcpD n=1 Tax=Serratia sp. (in: enterobacteria) TaxID=616 RepID=UPI003F341DAF
MKDKCAGLAILLAGVMFNGSALAVNPTNLGDAATMKFVFVENNADDDFFVTPAGGLDPRMTGANKWTGLKYGGSGTIYQQSLGYVDNGYNYALTANNRFDMWLENAPIKNPFLGLRCINWYAGCDMDTSLILPETTDEKGFYGAIVTSGGAKWMHGMMSPSFYQYLKQMGTGQSFGMQINGCQTNVVYNASNGERCQDQVRGNWYRRNVTHSKAAHLRFINTNAVSEVFVNSDGIPIIGEGNADCKNQTIGARSGIMCKMVSYDLQTDGSVSNTSIHIFPSINHAALASAAAAADLQFSLNGNSWKNTSGTASYYTFNELKSSNAVYVFFSSNFFKQMVNLGITDGGTHNLINFRFQNTTSPESGWYEFSTSNQLIIKPRDFSISIISEDYDNNPHREGYVGPSEPPLEFGYIVTTSAKTNADEVKVKVIGPSQMVNGNSYCIFSSPDSTTQVPFPAQLSITNSLGAEQVMHTGCEGNWHDMTNALWSSTPWNDISGDVGVMNKTRIKFRIPMNDPVSRKTVAGNDWYGDVHAAGEIHVEATWRDIN